MNILLLHPHDIYSPQEPWTIRIRKLAAEFVKKNHAVRLIYFPLNRQALPTILDEGIDCIPLSRRFGLPTLLRNIKTVLPLARWADLVHVQKCFYHAALPALLAAYLHRKPLHYDWDDWEIKIFLDRPDDIRLKPALWLPAFFLYAWERLMPCLCDSVSVSSERLRAQAIRWGASPRRIAKAPVGADTELFHPSVSGQRIRERYNIRLPLTVYVGQLHGSQYASMFIRAAKYLITKDGPAQYMIVGTGSRLLSLQRLARHLEISDYIIFTGAVPHTDVPLYMAAADVLVACFDETSVTECKSPLKVVEYMASGRPIVASAVGEVTYMLAGSGIITPPGDIQALAEGIRLLVADHNLRERLGQAARARVESCFTWKRTAENILHVYGSPARSTVGVRAEQLPPAALRNYPPAIPTSAEVMPVSAAGKAVAAKEGRNVRSPRRNTRNKKKRTRCPPPHASI